MSVRICFLLIVLASASISNLYGQKEGSIKLFSEKPLQVKTVPFSSIKVIDSRIDTNIYTAEDGKYPVKRSFLFPTAEKAINSLYDSLVKTSTRGEQVLLLNIKLLNVPNRQFIQRKGGPRGYLFEKVRDRLNAKVDAYVSENGGYLKVLEFNKSLKWSDDMQEDLSGLFSDVIIAATVCREEESVRNKQYKFLKDDDMFKFVTGKEQMSEFAIENSVLDHQKNYPIMKDNLSGNAVYVSFDDFKNNIKTAVGELTMTAASDSIYKFTIKHTDRSNFFVSPYAILKDGELYLWLTNHLFVKAEKDNDRLKLRLPLNSANFYELLAIEIINAKQPSMLILPGVPLELDAAAELLQRSLNKNEKMARTSAINNFRDQGSDYRTGIVDLYTGDIVYR